MRHRFRSTLAVLLLAASSLGAAQPVVTGPEKVFGEANDWIFLSVGTDGKGVKFVPLDSGLSLFPAGKLKDPNETAVKASKPGTYRLLAYSGSADGPSEPKIITVVVGQGPTPPTPGPDPPVPMPAPDPAADPVLVAKFRTALADDVRFFGEGDRRNAAILGGVYLEAAKALRADTTDTITVGQLYTITFNASVLAKVPRRDAALVEVRKVVDSLGKFDTATILKGEVKDKFVALWTRIGSSLQEAAKP